MPRRALAEKRPYLVLSVAAAVGYFYLQVSNLPGLYLIPIKGCAVAFLALYAWLRHGSKDAHMLAGALAFASLGDVAIEFHLVAGAIAFVGFHLLALMVFRRSRRGALEGRDGLIFIILLLGTPFAAYWLPDDTTWGALVAIYSLALGAMAAGAWASNFPVFRVGAGAILFVISDLLIFSEMGPLSGSPIPQLLIWPTYYLGMFLITVGVITTLRKRDPELRVVHGGKETLH